MNNIKASDRYRRNADRSWTVGRVDESRLPNEHMHKIAVGSLSVFHC
jgi:hypothetical protein